MPSNDQWVSVNQHQKITIEAGTSTLVDVLRELEIDSKVAVAVAVAIDNQIVTQSAWPDTVLHGGEQLSIFGAIAGG